MADIVPSLFGLTPGMYQQAQQQRGDEMALQYAKLDPFQQANYAIGRGAYGLAGAAGGLLGGQDPELQRITARQQIASQLNPNDLSTFQQAIAALAPTDPQGAMMVRAELEKTQLAQAKLASEQALTTQRLRETKGADPVQQLLRSGKFTPDSIAKYSTTGQIQDLENIDVNDPTIVQETTEGIGLFNKRTGARIATLGQGLVKEAKEPTPVVVGNALVNPVTGGVIYQGPETKQYSAFAKELIDAGLTPGTPPFEKRMLEYTEGKSKGAAKGTGNVTIGGITVDTGAAAKAAGKIIGESVANIENQYSLRTAFQDANKLVDQGIYGGAYGPEQAAATKYSLGLLGNKKKLENTEVFLANIGEIVIPRLQQFGGNDSNEELKYLQKIVAGDQRLEPAAVKRILASAEKKVENNIARLKKQAESGKTGAVLPTEPMPEPSPAIPKATKRFNPATGKIEAITGN